jgi:glycosyltransferase involved in cell wall biosynthesis
MERQLEVCRMNILINALSARLGGGQTYVKKLLEHIPEDYTGCIYVIAPDDLQFTTKHSSVKRLPVPTLLIKSVFFRTFWEIVFLPSLIRKFDINVLFCPGGLLNLKRLDHCKTVVTFQNMLPFDTSQLKKYGIGYSWLRNILLKNKLLSSMSKADLVIFISQFANQFVESILGSPLKNSVVIPHGIDKIFHRNQDDTIRLPDTFVPEKYLLYVSALDVYKSQCEVVHAYSLLRERHDDLPPLFLIGHQFPKYTKQVCDIIDKCNLNSHVILIDHMDYSSLPAVYKNSLVTLFMSQTENCPFILLEAMASGRPLVVSNMQPMPEFSKESVLYADPQNPEDIADKIEMFLENEKLRTEYAKKAEKLAYQFDWNYSATKTWQSIISLV